MSTYEKIINATYEYFALQGYERASMSQIAGTVGISKAALYHHFSSKEVLFEALYSHLIDAILSDFEQDIDNWQKDTYKQNLGAAGLKDLLSLKKDPQLGLVLNQFYLLSLRMENLNVQTKRLETQTATYHHSLVIRGVTLGLIKEQDAKSIAGLYTATLNGLTLDVIHSQSLDFKVIWSYFIDHLI